MDTDAFEEKKRGSKVFRLVANTPVTDLVWPCGDVRVPVREKLTAFRVVEVVPYELLVRNDLVRRVGLKTSRRMAGRRDLKTEHRAPQMDSIVEQRV